MEVEERCSRLGAEMDDHLLDNLWQQFGWESPEAEQAGPSSQTGAADLAFDPDASCDWEKLLDAEEIQRLWPEGFSEDFQKLGPFPEGAVELPTSWSLTSESPEGAPPLVCEPSAPPLQNSGRLEKQQGVSPTSSSVSQISTERQSNKEEPVQLEHLSVGKSQGKRSRNEDRDGSSEGDADSPEDSKRRARLVRNRESASQSRERKKQRLNDMEQRCAGLEEQVRALSRAVTATALENAALREELARQQMYHYPSAVAAAPGRSRGRGAKKSNGTEPAVLSSDSLPWSSLFHRSTCPPSPLAPSPPLRPQLLLASGPFLLFVLLLVWLASAVGSQESRNSSQQVSSRSQSVCSLQVAGLVRAALLYQRRRGKRRARRLSCGSAKPKSRMLAARSRRLLKRMVFGGHKRQRFVAKEFRGFYDSFVY